MTNLLAEPLLQRVLVAALLASVACGVIGSFVVARRLSSLAGGIAHAAFGGVGFGYWAGVSPMLGAAGFGVLASVVVGWVSRRSGSGIDTAIAIIWAVGMALGIVFIGLAPGYAPDLLSYLFGSLLFVPWSYVGWIACLDVGIVLAVGLLFKELQAVAFDEEHARVVGLPAEPLFLVLLALSALAIVTLIRVAGLILALALLTIPAALARQWSTTLPRMMVIATGVGALCSTSGLFLSYAFSAAGGVSIAPGPLIVLLAALAYGASTLVRHATRTA
ncbi:MAG: metal ABC transporter permease [Proteobacteria bacterium]|nr:metal ABC transporter permease [Pseudomonadota bacterium]